MEQSMTINNVRLRWILCACIVVLGHVQIPALAQDVNGQMSRLDEAKSALKKACRFYATKISVEGGYPYFAAGDGSTHWGENERLQNAAIVQPPGTPSVGMALLAAYKATGDKEYLDWALQSGGALIQGQLKSGGWAQVIYFEKPEKGRFGNYRKRPGGEWNQSSLDDNQTQASILFLIDLDETLKMENESLHECVSFAIDSLLKAQLPNGGFPQGWREPARTFSPASLAQQKASFPNYDWKTDGKVKNYWDYATLNDGLVGDVAEVLIRAHAVYGEEKYLSSLKRLGDFLLLAQMPEPQPGWCQQYNDKMQPIWARRFEPPAISGVESQDAMLTLIRIAEVTQEMRYLEPIPKALSYLRSQCLLADGRLARFYELKSNKALYMDQEYRLTYDDSSPPSHYGWKSKSRLDTIEKEYRRVKSSDTKTKNTKAPSYEIVKKVIEDLDDQGRWGHRYDGEKLMGSPKFKKGEVYVSSAEFVEGVELLSKYISTFPER